MQISPDTWLASAIGCAVFRVEVHSVDRNQELIETVATALSAVDGEGFFHAKVPVKHTGQVTALEECGFRVTDVNVTFSRPSGPPAALTKIETLRIAQVSRKEGNEAIALAGRCFTLSRFHLDPLIPNQIADRINEAWVADYVNGRRGVLLEGAFLDEKLVGFNAVLEVEEEGGLVLVIDLIGVDPDTQGCGIGAALVDSFLTWSLNRCDVVRVGTQVSNIPAIRLYEKSGFRLADARYVLHAHVRDGEIVGEYSKS